MADQADGEFQGKMDDFKESKEKKMTKRQELENTLVLEGHEATVACTKFSPNGELLATACANGVCGLWEASSGKFVDSFSGHTGGISTLSWSGDSQKLCTASDDKTVGVWDVETTSRVMTLQGHTDIVFATAHNPHQPIILSGGFDNCVKLWDTRSGKCTRSLFCHNDPVTGVDFNRSGSLFVSCGLDGLCRLWDLKSSHCLRTIVQDENPPMSTAKFSPNGKFVLTGSFGGVLQLWNYGQTKPLKTYRGHVQDRFCLSATFSVHQGNASILCGSENGSVLLWDLQSKKVTHSLKAHQTPVIAVDSSPTDGTIATAAIGERGGQGCEIRLWTSNQDDEQRKEQVDGHNKLHRTEPLRISGNLAKLRAL